MLDFIRVAAAVPDVAVGNAAENADRIIEKAAERSFRAAKPFLP